MLLAKSFLVLASFTLDRGDMGRALEKLYPLPCICGRLASSSELRVRCVS